MDAVKIGMWHEEFSIEAILDQLHQGGIAHLAVRELGQKFLYMQQFKEYALENALPEKLEELKQAFCQQLRIPSLEVLPRWLEMNHRNESELESELLYQEKLARLKKLVISDEAVKEAFLKRKARMDMVTFALMRIDNELLAKEIYYRLSDDQQDFSLLAKQYSSGAEAAMGGIIGPRQVMELNPELRDVLMKLKPNEFSQPFTLDGRQYIIAKMIRFDSAQLHPQLENSLREELFDQWTQRQLNLANIRLIRTKDADGQHTKGVAS